METGHVYITTRIIVLDLRVVQLGTDGNVSVLQEHTMTDGTIACQQEIIVQILHLVQHLVHRMVKKIHGTVFVIQDITGRIRI
jgi:hypothetical protein